jgi:hypothetical protein
VNINIKYEKNQLKEIISNVGNNRVLLPNFQRDYVWKSSQQERLAISCILRLPIGSLLILKGEENDFSYKDIAGLSSSSTKTSIKEVSFLLDGQQRITTLKFIFDDPFFHPDKNWDDICREIPQSLKVKFFIDVKNHQSGSDPFGYEDLKSLNIYKLEPSDLENRIKTFKVNISGNTLKQPHHPKRFIELENLAKKEGGRSPAHKAALDITKHFADKLLIPLFTVFWDSTNSRYPYALHEKVIDRIAKNRAEELKEDHADLDENDKLEFFENIYPGLSEEILNDDSNEYDFDLGWNELASRWAKTIKNIFEQIVTMEVPSTDLPREEITRAASIFEELNNSGTQLRVFDLLVARAARDSSFLGKETLSGYIINIVKSNVDVSQIKKGLQDWKVTELNILDGKVLTFQYQDAYLNLLSLICNAKEDSLSPNDVKFIKKESILIIKPETINKNTKRTIIGLSRALAFLQLKCGISNLSELPYSLMLLPIAYCFENDEVWSDDSAHCKIEFWYWNSLFNGRYRERQNERCVQDVARLSNATEESELLYEDGYTPNLLDDPKYNDLETLLMKDSENLPNSNVAKGIRQFVLSTSPKDFTKTPSNLTARNVSLRKLKVHIHHLIPLGAEKTIKQSSSDIRDNKSHILNSPLNLTLISDTANTSISSLPIENYITKLSKWSISTHLISSNISRSVSVDDNKYYEDILTSRYNALKDSLMNHLNSLSQKFNDVSDIN